jgi:translation initiation factor eIF-2B subunit gamma
VIMNDVEIGDNVKIENCVVCKGAKIGEKTSLDGCNVGAGFVVESGTKLKRENLVELDELVDNEEEEGEDEE